MTKKPARKTTAITWGKRLVLTVLILLAGGYGVLSLAERSTNSLRLGFQDYLSGLSGHKAEITDLPLVEMVPNMMFRMQGILIRDRENPDKILARADQVFIGMPLWRVIVGLPRYIGLEMRNVELASGYILPQKINIGYAGISDPSPNDKPAQFLIEGRYNNRDVLITVEMERGRTRKYYLYGFGNGVPLTFKIGSIEGTGAMHRHMSSLSLENINIRTGEQEATGRIEIRVGEDNLMDFEGMVEGVAFNGHLTKSGQNYTVGIIPQSNDIQSAGTISKFFEALSKELALEEGGTIKIDISAAHETQIKKDKTEE